MGGSTDSHMLEQFGTFLRRHRIQKYIVACSGGSDSVALAVAAAEIARDAKAKIIIGHVNHRLRGRASTSDADFVRRLGRRLKVPVRVFARPVGSASGNLEENAREARYAALFGLARRTGAQAVLTGHTLDDQAETLMMNVLRGCGTDGLGGMSALRRDPESGVLLARPFLGLAREDLKRFLGRRRMAHRTDATNNDPKFFRNYVRLKLFKMIERRAPGFRRRLAQLAELAGDEQAVWDRWTESGVKSIAAPGKRGLIIDGRKLRALPVALQRRVVRRAAGKDLLTFDGVEKLRTWMENPPSAGRLWQLRKGWIVERLSKSRGSPSSSMFSFRRSTRK